MPRPIRAVRTFIAKKRRRSAHAARASATAGGRIITRRAFLRGAAAGAAGAVAVGAGAKYGPRVAKGAARRANRFLDNALKDSPEVEAAQKRFKANERDRQAESRREFDAQIANEKAAFIKNSSARIEKSLSANQLNEIKSGLKSSLGRNPSEAELRAEISNYARRVAENQFGLQLRKRGL